MTIIRTIEAESADWAPGSHNSNIGGGPLNMDPGGYLRSRSLSLTDEGGYRTNFSGSSIDLSLGTCTFTNGSRVVTGTGFDNFAFLTGEYVKLTADSDSAYVQIDSIDSVSGMTLASAYTGTGGTGVGSISTLRPSVGTGAAITVGNGNCAISTGTISGSIVTLDRLVDYMPLTKQAGIAVAVRSLAQTIYIGFQHDAPVPFYFARFRLSDTDATRIVCETASNRAGAPGINEIETTSVKLPNNLTTNASLRYRIEILPDRVRFLVQGILVAENFKSIPNAYATLLSIIRVVNNTTVGISNVITVDYDGCQNFNNVITSNVNDQDPAPATTNDLETLNDIMGQILSRLSFPDAASRTRVSLETSAATVAVTIAATQAVNAAQINGQTTAAGVGIQTTGTMRTIPAYEGFAVPPQQLTTLYSNILTS